MYVLDQIQPIQVTVKGLRELHGLSLSEAALGIGINRKTLKKYELDSGEISCPIAIKIARYYGVSLDLIFWGTDQGCIAINRQRLNKVIPTRKMVAK